MNQRQTFLRKPLTKIKNCNKCRSQNKIGRIPWVPAIVVALIPKCPFCVMAYSGAITLCSGKKFLPEGTESSLLIFWGLCLFVFVSILLNFRDKRTWMALAIAGLGAGLLLSSQYFLWDIVWYYTGVLLLLLGSWLNGSLYSIISKNFFQNKYKTSDTIL